MRDWSDFLELTGVELQRSYLLSWRHQDDEVVLELDTLLAADHPLYEVPRPAEGECYRPGELVFPATTQVSASAGDSSSGLIQRLGELEEGRYLVEGAFGRIAIDSDTPFLRLAE